MSALRTKYYNLIITEFSKVTTAIFTVLSFFCYCFGVKSMHVAGIIIEYDPLHTGHIHLMEETRRILGEDTAIIGVMSGNFVQRGEFAIVQKHQRAPFSMTVLPSTSNSFLETGFASIPFTVKVLLLVQKLSL